MADCFLTHELQKRRENGLLRGLTRQSELVDLTSNDYLGLARSGELQSRAMASYQEIAALGPNGATGSRLLTGNHAYVEMLEDQIAQFHQAPAGLIYSSGYAANVGLLSSLAQKGDSIVLDTDVHASTWDGARLSGAKVSVFQHNSPESLDLQLNKAQGRTFVAVEALYSMSGDKPPLREIVQVCKKHGAQLIVDEAHSGGIMGPQGRGLVSELCLESEIFARVHTFGKALGAQGAIVMGSESLRDYLINFSRSFIYSTALPLYTLVLIGCAYEMLAQADDNRQRLAELIHYYGQHVELHTDTPIQCMQLPNVKEEAARIQAAGIDVRPIVYPTVRRGKDCLRICLHSFNSEEEIDRLLQELGAAV